MTTDKITLLPCPFCGGEAEFDGGGTQLGLNCMECGIGFDLQVSDYMTIDERSEPDAWNQETYSYKPIYQERACQKLIEHWNTRAPMKGTDNG